MSLRHRRRWRRVPFGVGVASVPHVEWCRQSPRGWTNANVARPRKIVSIARPRTSARAKLTLGMDRHPTSSTGIRHLSIEHTAVNCTRSRALAVPVQRKRFGLAGAVISSTCVAPAFSQARNRRDIAAGDDNFTLFLSPVVCVALCVRGGA